MKRLLLLGVMGWVGCAQSYWIQDPDWRAVRAGASTVTATRESGERVTLIASRLDSASANEDGAQVVVTAKSRKLRIGWALLGIGAGLLTGALISAATANAPTCHGDEECWLPQLIATSTLGSIGGVVLLAGGAVAGTSVRDAETR